MVGNQLLDGNGRPVALAGTNRSGTEYACAEGWGIFDGPTDDRSIDAMAAWGINAVRVPLNEDCWLGTNGVPAAFGGASYQAAVRTWTDRLAAHGMAVVLDLHLTAPGTTLPVGQAPMPDADHAPAFWSQVAATYKSVPGIAYDLFNEPRDVSWACWQHGCTVPSSNDGSTILPSYRAAGMQTLIDAVRAAGATQPVLVEGLSSGNDLSKWLSHPLNDPAGNLAAAWHVYQHSRCATASCWNAAVAPVAKEVPVVITELGETDCRTGFTTSLLSWADNHRLSYLAWTWDAWPGCGGSPLIASYDGTATSYGAAYRDHLAARSRF